MAVQIDQQTATKIKAFIGNGVRTRGEILVYIGEKATASTPFDTWAKNNLEKKGRGVFGVPKQQNASQTVKHVRLADSDRRVIAELAAMEALLSTSRVLTDEIVQLAGDRSGIKPLPIGLRAAIEPHFNDAWAELLSSLLLDKKPQIEVVEIEKPIDRFKTEELVAELLRRMPQYVPLVSAFYGSINETGLQSLPPLQRLLTPVSPKKEVSHVLVTGLYSRQSSDFLQRTKIDHAIRSGNLRITFIDQDRVRWSFPSTVSKVFMFDKRSHKLWEACCKAYGAGNITEFHGMGTLEECVLRTVQH